MCGCRKQPAVRAAEARAWAALAQVRSGGARGGPGGPPEAGLARRPAAAPAVAQSSSRVDGSGDGAKPEPGRAWGGDERGAAVGKPAGGAEDGWAEWRGALAAAHAPFLGESSGARTLRCSHAQGLALMSVPMSRVCTRSQQRQTH